MHSAAMKRWPPRHVVTELSATPGGPGLWSLACPPLYLPDLTDGLAGNYC